MAGFKMDDYVPVNERVEQFYRTYPEGSIQSEIVELTASRVTVKAFAYRKPDDPRPGIGHSSLGIPGATSFTKGSEIENAETSAWGRAIAALGFEVKRGIASAEEVRNKPDQPPARSAPPAPAPSPRERLLEAATAHSLDAWSLERLAKRVGVPSGQHANDAQIEQIIALIETPEQSNPPSAAPATDPILDAVLAQTGGTVEPAKPEYVVRAEARARAAAPKGARETPEPIGMGLDA